MPRLLAVADVSDAAALAAMVAYDLATTEDMGPSGRGDSGSVDGVDGDVEDDAKFDTDADTGFDVGLDSETAVCNQTFAESMGWPTTTPHTPAVYPAATLFRMSVVMVGMILLLLSLILGGERSAGLCEIV